MTDLGNVLILGDSYSTFEGFIPSGYATYYYAKGRPETDVRNVNETWWHTLLNETGSKLILNSSFSGTTICHTGYNGEDYSHKSFISRLDKLIDEGFFKENSVDTFIIFGGTNDDGANAPIGNFQYENWQKADLYSVFPAICYLLNRSKSIIHGARIIFIINTHLKKEVEEGIKSACNHYCVEYIALKDIEKNSGHPTITGMKQIKDQVLEYLNQG